MPSSHRGQVLKRRVQPLTIPEDEPVEGRRIAADGTPLRLSFHGWVPADQPTGYRPQRDLIREAQREARRAGLGKFAECALAKAILWAAQ